MSMTAHRAETQKAYKKAKKKRRKIKKAEKKRELALKREENQKLAEDGASDEVKKKAPKPTKWRRIGREDGCKKAVDRSVDDDKITELLERRSKAKTEKNYSVSDEIMAQLVDMEIVYDDAKKEWHTRALSTVAQKAKAKREE